MCNFLGSQFPICTAKPPHRCCFLCLQSCLGFFPGCGLGFLCHCQSVLSLCSLLIGSLGFHAQFGQMLLPCVQLMFTHSNVGFFASSLGLQPSFDRLWSNAMREVITATLCKLSMSGDVTGMSPINLDKFICHWMIKSCQTHMHHNFR